MLCTVSFAGFTPLVELSAETAAKLIRLRVLPSETSETLRLKSTATDFTSLHITSNRKRCSAASPPPRKARPPLLSIPPQRRITSGYSSHSLAYEGSQRRENHRGKTLRERGAHGQEWHPVRSLTPHNPTQSREIDYHRDREMARRASYQFRGDSHLYRSSKNKSRHSYQSCEEGRRVPSARRSPTPQEASANSHHKTQPYERGIPLPMGSTNLPIVAVENAVGVIRETLSQYTACADPSESAARRERVRLAEAQVLARLGPLTQENGLLDNRNSTGTSGPKTRSQDRAHVRERLGPYLPEMTISPTRHSDRPSPQSQKTPGSNSIERIPIASRLGPVSTEVRFEDVEFQTDPGSQRDRLPAKDRIGKALASPLSAAAGKKRKPGRPPGPRKVVSSPGRPLSETSWRLPGVQSRPGIRPNTETVKK
ncbi:hypothetical protein HID58_032580 [Brassica napus]|uniref:Uncharacterized protein n=1 Tax=Brassica napus TaxID=3708 RepID=A0ABQ8BWU6_BRANA|nr:hypothetical protein HID58_032580 [Brassica napus]